MDQKEQIITRDNIKITFEEVKRRTSNTQLQKLNVRFQDLECNGICVTVSNGRFQNRSTEFDESPGYLRIISTLYWTDPDDNLTISTIKSKDGAGEFKTVKDVLTNISPKSLVETEFRYSIGDYSLEDEVEFFVRIGSDENKAILRVIYPDHSERLGSLSIFVEPDDELLQEKIDFFEKAILILSEKKLIPNVGSNSVQIRFKDKFNAQAVLNQIESLRSRQSEYRDSFLKDLAVLESVKTTDGFHRAIVYFLGPKCGLIFMQNTDLIDQTAVRSHARVLESWKEDPDREHMVNATGFSTDSMANYMHTFIKFDENGVPVWFIDRGNPYPGWFNLGGFTEEQIAIYLSENFGVKNEFGIVSPDVSKRMALSGALGEKILTDAELLRHEYGTRYRNKYIALAEKFRIQEKEPFSTGWEDFQALEVLIRKLRDSKIK